MKLFPKEQVVGIFRGFNQGGLEFHAELVLPYRNEFQRAPMHGQFLLIQLETDEEAVLGRITSVSSEGKLTSSSGEDYGIRAINEDRSVPEDLREQYLKYRVEIRVLGIVRVVNGSLVFAASHRRLPHVGSKVAFLSDEGLKEIAGHTIDGADLGFFALGEFVYAGSDPRLKPEPWMQIRHPTVIPKFPIKNLVSRRSFVFARAGFGKSNLNKLLFSSLYKETPTVTKRGGKVVPVGTIIFDPDSEYFWPDDKDRPGLCDVPDLEDKIVVFTNKKGPSPFYQSFVAGDIKIDIRRLRPSEVISIAIAAEKQDQQNIRKLKSLNQDNWERLVDEIYAHKNLSDPDLIKELLHLEPTQDAEMVAARANMSTIVTMLHDPGSMLLDMLLEALKAGKICIIDISQLRGEPSLVLSGIILQRVFDHNQKQFTEAEPKTIPTIAVVEEAQTVLGNAGSSRPYVEWVKEGRKYDLGALMITQQPGSIATEILSQGDNWFTFHLLSAGDLQALKRANAHYSDDLLSSLLNEPIVGHCIYWSSAGGRVYPISVRVLSFEKMYAARDPTYSKPAGNTYAIDLISRFAEAIAKNKVAQAPVTAATPEDEENEGKTGAVDYLETYKQQAIERLKEQTDFLDDIAKWGKPWRAVVVRLEELLPDVLDSVEKNRIAFNLTTRALDECLGVGNWESEKRPSRSGSGTTTWVKKK